MYYITPCGYLKSYKEAEQIYLTVLVCLLKNNLKNRKL